MKRYYIEHYRGNPKDHYYVFATEDEAREFFEEHYPDHERIGFTFEDWFFGLDTAVNEDDWGIEARQLVKKLNKYCYLRRHDNGCKECTFFDRGVCSLIYSLGYRLPKGVKQKTF